MTIIAFSDSHGKVAPLRRLVLCRQDADLFLFLGDGISDIAALRHEFPEKAIVAVRGNCDFSSDEETTISFCFDGIRLLATHGHLFLVKHGTEPLLRAAKSGGYTAAIFGHTHLPLCEYHDGIWLVNPGSLVGRNGAIRFAVLETTARGLHCHLAALDE